MCITLAHLHNFKDILTRTYTYVYIYVCVRVLSRQTGVILAEKKRAFTDKEKNIIIHKYKNNENIGIETERDAQLFIKDNTR